jgi:hypothetical protein
MVSINGTAGPVLPHSRRVANNGSSREASSSAAPRGAAVNSSSRAESTNQSSLSGANSSKASSVALARSTSPNAVASAVALSVKAMKSADYQQSQVQYDSPEGKSRKALEAYFGVMSQAKREELAQMLGVDMYI